MFSQPVTQLMCFNWESNNDWEGNGFPPDQLQALVSRFIYLPIYLLLFTVKEIRKEMGLRRELSRPLEGRRSEIQTRTASRPSGMNLQLEWERERQRRLRGQHRGRDHLLGGEDRCNLSFTNNVEAAHYFGTLSPTPSSFWSKTE